MACSGCGSKKKAVTKNSPSPSMGGMSNGRTSNFQSYVTTVNGEKFKVTGKKKVKR